MDAEYCYNNKHSKTFKKNKFTTEIKQAKTQKNMKCLYHIGLRWWKTAEHGKFWQSAT